MILSANWCFPACVTLRKHRRESGVMRIILHFNFYTMPEKLKSILSEAPLAWGIVALADYRQGKKTVSQIIREWEAFKLLHYA